MKEFERRWVIEYPELAFDKLEPLCVGDAHNQLITTTYLSSDWRIKHVDSNGHNRYYLTKKMPKSSEGFREESTINLTKDEYSSCLDQVPQIVGVLKYHRLKLTGGNNYDKYGITELCIDRVVDGPTIIEVEFKDKESMEGFNILNTMKEITMKGSYKYFLARKGYGSH